MNPTGSSQRQRQVETVYQAALDHPPDRRATYLARVGARDPLLRRDVEALLQHYAAADGDFLERIVRCPADAKAALPSRLGRYRILRRIGQGGMGVVFEAEQDHPRRRVAIKIIRSTFPSDAALRRFAHEATILGRLQHPGIAHVYEAGFGELETAGHGTEPQPYFAMELVHGATLDRHVSERRPGLRERLALFTQICEAVAHAHQKGVIHRDLKPANVLVTTEGMAKILDFGVARVTDADVHLTAVRTTAADLVGTLPYMSPEQVAGRTDQLDTRSDVYALGVLLYELLAERLPYDLAGQPLAVAARTIAEIGPTPLGSARPALRGELETIVAKALAKHPSDRYASVRELAADVQRYLRHEPISAQPASAYYQLRKFAQRNRALVGGAGAALVALVLGLTAAVHGLIQASHERNQKAAALAEEQQARAETEAVVRFLEDMLAAADPTREGREARVVDLLDRAAADIATRFTDQPRVAARLRHVIGVTYQELGVYDAAEPHLAAALETRARVLGQRHSLTLDTLHELGVLYNQWGRYDAAAPLLTEALDGSRAVRGVEHPHSLATLHELGSLYSRQGRYTEAMPLHVEALAVSRRIHGADHPQTLSTANNLGLLYKRMGRLDDAERLYRETLATRVRVLGPEHPDTLVSMNNLAHLYRALTRYEEAAALHAETLEIRRRVLGDAHPYTVMSLDNLAMLMTDLERYAEAEALHLEALSGKRRLYGDDGPETLVSRNNLAILYTKQDRLDEAETIYRGVLETRRSVLGDDHPDTAISLEGLADVLVKRERDLDAEALYREALAVRRERFGDEHPYVALNLCDLGEIELRRGDNAKAAALFAEALRICRKQLPPDHLYTAASRARLGRAHLALGNHAEAETLLLAAYDALASEACAPDRRRLVPHLVALYEAWHTAAPSRGYDRRAAEWRARAAASEP